MYSNKHLFLLLVTCTCCSLTAFVKVISESPEEKIQTENKIQTPVPSSVESSPLNTQGNVRYIGSAACKECHRDQHQSWLQTTHSRSMAKVSPEDALAVGEFQHKPSNSRYEVFVKNDQLIHRETQLDPSGKPISETEHPILYTIGSGTHGKGYIYRDNLVFGQSPISWYQETGTWHMSPGYDMPFHPGFTMFLSKNRL